MTITVTPNQKDIQRALGTFLTSVLPVGTEVIVGQINRTPEPVGPNFAVIWPINRGRLATNLDDSEDVSFTASIAGTVMTVSAVQFGEIRNGASVFGVNLNSSTAIASFGTGTGGVGTYNISPSQTVASEKMSAGFTDVEQFTEVTMQVDVHGPSCSDNVEIISTLFRDAYGVDAFTAINPAITPLFASEPRQVPFNNAENQIEDRYIIDLHFQVNQSVSVPQQFADVVEVDVISVEATYP